MGFDFFEAIFFLIWVGLFIKAITGILTRGRRRPPEGAPEEETPDVPPEGSPEEPPATPRQWQERGEESGYDYKALRKRILDSWQEKEEEKETDLPDEMEKPVYTEPAPAAEQPQPERPEPVKPTVKPVTVSTSIRQDEEWVKRMEAYANRPREAKKPTTPVMAAVTHTEKRRMSTEDAKRWVVYDAVFGKPRAMRPWRAR